MNKPIKQHYIPQFLLRGFGSGKKNKERLWTLDKKMGKTFCGSVRDAAHENRCYEATNSNGDSLEAETLLARVDGWGASALKNIIRDERLSLSDGVATGQLSHFVAAQMVRVTSVRNEMEQFRKMIIDKWGPDVRAGDDTRPVSDYGPEDDKFSSITALRDVPMFAKLLQEKILFLLKAPLGTAFILSDNPVIRHNEINHWPRGNLGLRKKGIEVYLPITPHLCLQFVCPDQADKLRYSSLGQIYIQAQNKGLPIMLDTANVEFVNSGEVLSSERFIYARTENDLAIAKSMLAENPKLSDPASSHVGIQ